MRHSAPVVLCGILFCSTTLLWLRMDHAPPQWDDSWYLTNSLVMYDALTDGGLLGFAKKFFSILGFKAPLITVLPTPIFLALGRRWHAAYLVNVAASDRHGGGRHVAVAGLARSRGPKAGGPVRRHLRIRAAAQGEFPVVRRAAFRACTLEEQASGASAAHGRRAVPAAGTAVVPGERTPHHSERHRSRVWRVGNRAESRCTRVFAARHTRRHFRVLCRRGVAKEGGEPESTFFNQHFAEIVDHVRQSGWFEEMYPSRTLPDGGIAHIFRRVTR